jgi:peroxisomal 3,2-trans-enoyl-CoA isomerase
MLNIKSSYLKLFGFLNLANNLQKFVASFIDFPKLIFALVNGPSVGIMVTILGLCDVVYATHDATFVTPFSLLGQSPEGCSSFTFPRLMNRGKAMEMICFNKRVSASEAESMGLVTRVFDRSTFMTETGLLIKSYSELPIGSLIAAKKLIRKAESEALHRANKSEVEELRPRWGSEECLQAVLNFFQRKAKL